jgi:hypothetical protein
MPWQSWPDFTAWLHQWQNLVAGVLGSSAAMVVVWLTLSSEKRRARRQALALRRALLSEIWGLAEQALAAYRTLMEKLAAGSPFLSTREVEDAARFTAPVIFNSAGGQVGLLGDEAHEIIVFHQTVQTFKDTLARMRVNLERGGIGAANPEDLVGALLRIAEIAAPLLPKLRVYRQDARADPEFARAVGQARERWDALVEARRRPENPA